MRNKFAIMVLVFLMTAWSGSGRSSKERNFNLRFCYGVGARDILDTYNNAFTKDLVGDEVTVPFVVSDSELQCISGKMTEIGFFNYPDTFVVAKQYRMGVITPYITYYFQVTRDSISKNLYWEDCLATSRDSLFFNPQDSTVGSYHIVREDSATSRLRQLITLVERHAS